MATSPQGVPHNPTGRAAAHRGTADHKVGNWVEIVVQFGGASRQEQNTTAPIIDLTLIKISSQCLGLHLPNQHIVHDPTPESKKNKDGDETKRKNDDAKCQIQKNTLQPTNYQVGNVGHPRPGRDV